MVIPEAVPPPPAAAAAAAAAAHMLSVGPCSLTPASLERFRKIEKLGEGTYGVVYKCEDLLRGELVALKRIRLEAEDNGVPSTAIREIAILKDLNHPNIVRLIDIVSERSKMYLVFECLHCDVRKILDMRLTPFFGHMLASLSYQILRAIQYCHRRNIIHRDLKPQNLLLTRDCCNVKLADFGLARVFHSLERSYTTEVITLWYRPPELLLGERKYTPSVDIWSVACIISELATKRPLFPGTSEIDQIFRIFRVLGTPTEEEWPYITSLPEFQHCFPKWAAADLHVYHGMQDASCADLLQKMLRYDPEQRITVEDALAHPFFDAVREDDPGEALLVEERNVLDRCHGETVVLQVGANTA